MALIRVSKLWKKGHPIPFTMTAGIRQDNGANILAAIKDWNEHTNVNLVENIGFQFVQGGYIRFTRGESVRNCSPVGRQGGRQDIKAANASVQTLVHEIGHALGLWHEHQRADRSRYIYIVEEQMDSDEYKTNYGLKLPPWSMYHGSYDCKSVMHYTRQGLTKGGKFFAYFDALPWSCSSLGSVKRKLGGTDTWLSKGDIAAINTYY